MSEIFPPPLIVNYVTYFRFPLPKSRGGKKTAQACSDVEDGKDVEVVRDFGVEVGVGEIEGVGHACQNTQAASWLPTALHSSFPSKQQWPPCMRAHIIARRISGQKW